jgi:hypothetical protein
LKAGEPDFLKASLNLPPGFQNFPGTVEREVINDKKESI